jgi:hypothetical protein
LHNALLESNWLGTTEGLEEDSATGPLPLPKITHNFSSGGTLDFTLQAASLVVGINFSISFFLSFFFLSSFLPSFLSFFSCGRMNFTYIYKLLIGKSARKATWKMWP